MSLSAIAPNRTNPYLDPTPDGKRVYVANFTSHDVSVIDTLTNTVVAPSIPVGAYPFGVAITPLPKNNPTNKDQCKNGRWKTFGFKNQGQCIQYVNALNKHNHGDKHDQGDNYDHGDK